MEQSTCTRLFAAVAVPVLLAAGLAQAGASTDDLPTVPTYGLTVPPVDGDPADDRTRWEVTLAPGRDDATSDGESACAEAVGDSGEDDGAREDTGWTLDAPRLGSSSPASAVGVGGTAEAGDPPGEELRDADPRVHGVHPVHGDVVELVGAADLTLDEVLALPGVVAAEPVSLQWPTATDQYQHLQWGKTNTGQTIQNRTGRAGVDVGHAEAAALATGRGVVVAVVDSGIQADHPDLTGRLWANGDETCGNGRDDDGNRFVDDCAGWDFANHDATPYDPGANNDHGTHVAGTIAATTGNDLGVASLAPGATIMGLKVFDGGSAPSTRIAAAIHYAVDNGADVINLSLGGNSPSSAQYDAIRRARDAGVLVVAAAGNDGRDTDTTPTWPVAYDLDNIVAVGSHANEGSISTFSNRGATSVDLFAPGEGIAATVPGNAYAYMSGTSMATPMVAAAAALVAESLGSADAALLKRRLLDGMRVRPALGGPLTMLRAHHWTDHGCTSEPCASTPG